MKPNQSSRNKLIDPRDCDRFDYYAPRPLGGGHPIALFRVLKNASHLPDRLTAHGWVRNTWLLLKIMSGDIGPPDRVDFRQAQIFFRVSPAQNPRAKTSERVTLKSVRVVANVLYLTSLR